MCVCESTHHNACGSKVVASERKRESTMGKGDFLTPKAIATRMKVRDTQMCGQDREIGADACVCLSLSLCPWCLASHVRAQSKGLQKLRWFCQVCQKQCRDENGFKCHATSESHQRQMLIVANDPDKFISGYSELVRVIWRLVAANACARLCSLL